MKSDAPSDPFNRKDKVELIEFDEVFPSPTKGNGQLVSNNYKTGAAQGRSSFIRKAKCQQCGFPVDLSRVDHTGGSLDGNGAGGNIIPTTTNYTYPNGTPLSITAGNQEYQTNAGCPFCFSKNSAIIKRDITSEQGADRIPPLGF